MPSTRYCSIHGKKRSHLNLVPDGFGGWKCTPESPCTPDMGIGKGGPSDHAHMIIAAMLGVPLEQVQSGQAASISVLGAGSQSKPDRHFNQGDWLCPKCQYHNFVQNKVCNRKGCGAVHPHVAAETAKTLDMVKSPISAMNWQQAAPATHTLPRGWAKGKGGGGKQGGRQGGDLVICSLHQKKRSSVHMIDDGYGGKCCAPGYECQIQGGSINLQPFDDTMPADVAGKRLPQTGKGKGFGKGKGKGKGMERLATLAGLAISIRPAPYQQLYQQV